MSVKLCLMTLALSVLKVCCLFCCTDCKNQVKGFTCLLSQLATRANNSYIITVIITYNNSDDDDDDRNNTFIAKLGSTILDYSV